MSGALCAASGTASVPVLPYNTVITLIPGGSASYNVGLASGNLYNNAGGVQISIQDTGGTPPYLATPGQALQVISASAGANAFIMNPGIANNTVGWSGLNSPGDYVAFTLTNGSSDSGSPQQSASDQFPDAGVAIIQRV